MLIYGEFCEQLLCCMCCVDINNFLTHKRHVCFMILCVMFIMRFSARSFCADSSSPRISALLVEQFCLDKCKSPLISAIVGKTSANTAQKHVKLPARETPWCIPLGPAMLSPHLRMAVTSVSAVFRFPLRRFMYVCMYICMLTFHRFWHSTCSVSLPASCFAAWANAPFRTVCFPFRGPR